MAAAPSRLDELARRLQARWAADPVAYFHEALGLRTWWRQDEILTAITQHRRVAVKAGQKVSKSCTAAGLALWYAMTRRGARVVCASSSGGQLKKVIWHELRSRIAATSRTRVVDGQTVREAGIAPIGVIVPEEPSTGIRFRNGSEIFGVSPDNPTVAAGISGADMLYVLDESTGIPDEIFEAFDGNTSGGGKILAISNPTSTSGWFFDAFQAGSAWHQITISSEEAAAVDPPIRGLATREYLEEKSRPSEWGRGSTIWDVRVKGEFPRNGGDTVVSLALVAAAEERWTEAPQGEDATAPLRLGVDVGGDGTDPSSIVWSRGRWSSRPIVLPKASTPELVQAVCDLVRERRRPGERATVKIDSTSIGHGAYGYLKLETELMDVIGVESHSGSPDPTCYRMRDAVWMSLRSWLGTGAIAKDHRLRSDLTAPKYDPAPDGRHRVEPKPAIRKRLKRSTDRADALALAVFDDPRGEFQWDGVADLGGRDF